MIDRAQLDAIAGSLGGWLVDDTQSGCPRMMPPPNAAMLSEGAGIFVREDKGKLLFHGLQPRKDIPSGWYWHPKGGWPSIGVSASRAPDVIAREIERRLLPEYRDAWTECMQRLADKQAYDASTSTLAQELSSILGVHVRGADKNQFNAYEPVYAQFTVNGDNVRVEHLSLTRAQAIAFVRLLATFKG